jgi:hypothetical protein
MNTRTAFVILAAAIGITCKNEGTAPGTPDAPAPNPTSLVVSLTTPNSDDGAIFVTVRGPALATIQSASPDYLVFSHPVSTTEARVIVIGDLTRGSVFTVALAGSAPLSDYSASIGQIATRADVLRPDATGYRMTIAAGAP